MAYGNNMFSAYRGIEEYKPYPCFVLHVLAIHICPHFECVDAEIVCFDILVHTFSHTIHTCVLALSVLGRGAREREMYEGSSLTSVSVMFSFKNCVDTLARASQLIKVSRWVGVCVWGV